MNFKLIINIAKALLLARWKQTLVAAIGVTFSIGMFITLLSFMTGLNDMLDGLILNRTPHIRLYNEIKPSVSQPINMTGSYRNYHNFIRSIKATGTRQTIYNNGAIMQALLNDKRVLGFSPKITAQVFFNDGAIEITGAVNGIDVQTESKLFHFSEYIITGSATDLEKVPNSIVLGKGLADKLLADIDDVVQLTTAQGEIFQLKVVGYFQSGILELDKTQSYASIITTQKVLGQVANYITDIQIKLNDMNQAPSIAKEYRQLFGSDAEDIQTANSQFETGSFVRTLISYAVEITLLIVAGFGIYNILNMMIFEKMDTKAILKAIGFLGSDIKSIFLAIALSIGFFGGLLGLMLGLGLSTAIDRVPFTTASL